MSLTLGQTLDDRYLLEAQIGSGGMARVFRAKNQRTGKAVAVKEIYLPANEQADTLRGWLRREIKALMVLDHPNVVQLIDHGETADGTPWVVTELLDGKDLEESVANKGPMNDAAVVEVALQALSAFKTAHELSIVHRDIKPGNLFLCSNGRVVVLDFGLARATSGEVSATLAEGFGTKIMGTPQYWSPEQIRGVTLDVKSDIFSIGGSLYYLLTGKPPFPGTTPFEIAGQIMMKKRVPLKDAAPKCAPDIVALIEKMLEEDTAARPTSAEFLKGFEAIAKRVTNGKEELQRYLGKAGASRPVVTAVPVHPAPSNPVSDTDPNTAGLQTGMSTMVTPMPPRQETVTNVRVNNVDATNVAPVRREETITNVTVQRGAPESDPEFHSQTRVVTAQSRPRAKKARPLPLVIAVAALLIVGAGVLVFARPSPPPPTPPTPVVPPPPAPAAPPDVPPAIPKAVEPPREPDTTPAPRPDQPKKAQPTPPPETGSGTLAISLKQWAEVVIDGESHGKQMVGAKFTLSAGKHAIVFKNQKFADRKTTVVIKRDKDTPLKLDFENALP